MGLILAGCLGFIIFSGTYAEDIGDVARVAGRRATPALSISGRQKSGENTFGTTLRSDTGANTGVRARTTNTSRSSGITERGTTATSRNTGNVVSRGTSTTASRVAIPTNSSSTPRSTTRALSVASTGSGSRSMSRATTSGTVTREDILSRNYSKCKTVFFDCMDEFCANKDTQLKRCACSSRINEFDSIKKQLDAAEDKMLDFNQRLLTVNMDKEDAAALNVATEGETAFLSTKDNTKSKQTLDAIKKKLNTSFDTSTFNTDLNVLSWSLDVDAAFDNVDSLMGASTTSKSGTALYSAALPVCRQMAAEVCDDTDVSLAEGGYQALIEQDCNTVAKTYQTQTAQARAQVLEGSALLDMSRLDIYQKRNSDDILTCKKKMLDMLTDSTVCGDELGKCLDVTGQYINPTTGEVFLTPQLVNLTTLLSRPDDNATWSTTAKNSTFVTFLNSKKKFLQPATEHCQDIADAVWDSFIEDALAQIKLAQDKKLDDVRQSCTVLTGQCLSEAKESITQFDARALSTFGIAADQTANAMCTNVINSCTALLNTTNDGDLWNKGVSEITTANTYESLMQTCRQVGRACIVQVCTSTSGNFGLCENIATSTNRKTIINHDACWDEVKDCIASAGAEAIDKIIDEHLAIDAAHATNANLNFYDVMYYDANNNTTATVITNEESSQNVTCASTDINTANCIFDMCATECAGSDTFACRTCRLAERIWGNCEVAPKTNLTNKGTHNRIKVDNDASTLLYWFAVNTGTSSANDSCRDTTCGIGYLPHYNSDTGLYTCISSSQMCTKTFDNPTMEYCTDNINTPAGCQCCTGKPKDSAGNCCENGITVTNTFTLSPFANQEISFCAPSNNSVVLTEPYTQSGDSNGISNVLICGGTVQEHTSGQLQCNGTLIRVEITAIDSGNGGYNFHYFSPTAPVNSPYVNELYMGSNGTCTYQMSNGIYNFYDNNASLCSEYSGSANQSWSVKYAN